jgi:hypothetical protein
MCIVWIERKHALVALLFHRNSLITREKVRKHLTLTAIKVLQKEWVAGAAGRSHAAFVFLSLRCASHMRDRIVILTTANAASYLKYSQPVILLSLFLFLVFSVFHTRKTSRQLSARGENPKACAQVLIWSKYLNHQYAFRNSFITSFCIIFSTRCAKCKPWSVLTDTNKLELTK